MSAVIKIFHVSGQCFRHVMNPYFDRIELRDESDRTLLSYCDGTKVFADAERLGSFSLCYVDGRPRWFFCETGVDAGLDLGPDLPSAKVELSRRFIRQRTARMSETIFSAPMHEHLSESEHSLTL